MVVDGLDLDVPAGEIVGLIGANGAGKTTTVECIQGLRKPDSGQLRVLGLDPVTQAEQLRPQFGFDIVGECAHGGEVDAAAQALAPDIVLMDVRMPQGKTNGEIAAELFVSEGTVKTHVNHLFTKLRLRDRAAAVVFAYDHGLVKRPG